MELFNLSYGDFERFIFVLVRVGAFIVFAPVLGSQQFPARIKAGFILLLSLSVFPLVRQLPMAEPRGLLDFTIYLFSEATVGLALAYATRLIFTVVQIAGTVVDFQMGFGVVNVIDPQTETQVSVTAQFQNIFAILLVPGAERAPFDHPLAGRKFSADQSTAVRIFRRNHGADFETVRNHICSGR